MSVRNGNLGVSVQNGAAGSACYLALDGALIAGNMSYGIGVGIPVAVAVAATVTVTRCTIANNSADGVLVSTLGSGPRPWRYRTR
jgi:IMP dehydrogenase/GMP reductase